MNKYEKLLSEYPDLDVSEEEMKHEGLYCDGSIWIRKDLPSLRKACILAEEIGHHETSSGVIVDTSDTGNAKQEYVARKWAYKKLVPLEDIYLAFSCGYGKPYEMAEFLQVDEAFLYECLKSYGFI